jgi:hypothetical protein
MTLCLPGPCCRRPAGTRIRSFLSPRPGRRSATRGRLFPRPRRGRCAVSWCLAARPAAGSGSPRAFETAAGSSIGSGRPAAPVLLGFRAAGRAADGRLPPRPGFGTPANVVPAGAAVPAAGRPAARTAGTSGAVRAAAAGAASGPPACSAASARPAAARDGSAGRRSAVRTWTAGPATGPRTGRAGSGTGTSCAGPATRAARTRAATRTARAGPTARTTCTSASAWPSCSRAATYTGPAGAGRAPGRRASLVRSVVSCLARPPSPGGARSWHALRTRGTAL